MSHDKCVGIVLDVSLNHTPGGRRILDVVKNQLREFIRNNLINGGDVFYLYHPQLVETLRSRGDQVCAVANYETNGNKMDVEFALKQTLYVLAAEDEDLDKTVILISDRIGPEYSRYLKKFHRLNEVDEIECELFVIRVGRHELLDFPGVTKEIDAPEEIRGVIEEYLYGENRSNGIDWNKKSDLPDTADE